MKALLIFLVVLIIFFFALPILKPWSIPKQKRASFKDSATTFTATTDKDKPLTKLDRIINKVTRNRTKNYGKYNPGTLGLSAVSKAIKKDYGTILNRRQRKHYSKAYGIPFIAYVGC